MKEKIREEVRLRRLQQSPALKKKKEVAILRELKKLPEFKSAQTVLLYLPIHGEVDLSVLLDSTAMNKKIVLPRVESKKTTLTLYQIKKLADVEVGAYGILEPRRHLPKIKPTEIDLALIPGIAFDKKGHRIGYGKGFYDRLLKKLTCPKIGIAYGFQIVKNVAGEKHDVPMNMILTEKGPTRIPTP